MPRPRTGKALSDAERMRRYRARRRAAGLRSVRSWAPREPVWSDHRIADAKSLGMHVLAAQRIGANPALLARAREMVRRWLQRCDERPPAALVEWRKLLERPWREVAAHATALTEEGARLRQSSPLAALLTAAERRRIHDAFRIHATAVPRHGLTRRETLLEPQLRKLVEGRIGRDFAKRRR